MAKPDRLSRSARDGNDLIDRCSGERAAKTLMSVSDSIDTRTAAGRLVLNVLMSVAQWERETIAERTTEALRHKKDRGECVGKVPFGWDLGPDGRSLVEDPVEQEARTLIRRWHRAGWTLQAIGAELLRRGIVPRSGRPAWSPSVIRHLALNTPDAARISEVAPHAQTQLTHRYPLPHPAPLRPARRVDPRLWPDPGPARRG